MLILSRCSRGLGFPPGEAPRRDPRPGRTRHPARFALPALRGPRARPRAGERQVLESLLHYGPRARTAGRRAPSSWSCRASAPCRPGRARRRTSRTSAACRGAPRRARRRVLPAERAHAGRGRLGRDRRRVARSNDGKRAARPGRGRGPVPPRPRPGRLPRSRCWQTASAPWSAPIPRSAWPCPTTRSPTSTGRSASWAATRRTWNS